MLAVANAPESVTRYDNNMNACPNVPVLGEGSSSSESSDEEVEMAMTGQAQLSPQEQQQQRLQRQMMKQQREQEKRARANIEFLNRVDSAGKTALHYACKR